MFVVFSVASSGGGSGGAVVIQANSFTNIGLITVKGGDANITAWKIMNNTVFSNAAGGGGRVAIYVSLILYHNTVHCSRITLIMIGICGT